MNPSQPRQGDLTVLEQELNNAGSVDGFVSIPEFSGGSLFEDVTPHKEVVRRLLVGEIQRSLKPGEQLSQGAIDALAPVLDRATKELQYEPVDTDREFLAQLVGKAAEVIGRYSAIGSDIKSK